jgi:hypothetical protein
LNLYYYFFADIQVIKRCTFSINFIYKSLTSLNDVMLRPWWGEVSVGVFERPAPLSANFWNIVSLEFATARGVWTAIQRW